MVTGNRSGGGEVKEIWCGVKAGNDTGENRDGSRATQKRGIDPALCGCRMK